MATKPKLELAWIDQKSRPRLEARILLEEPAAGLPLFEGAE